MSENYKTRFAHADDVVHSLNDIVGVVEKDPLIMQKYAGFVSVVGVTVYELALKDIFIDFAKRKHPAFGDFVEQYFEKINGRIGLDQIKGTYLNFFGADYRSRFVDHIEKKARDYHQGSGQDIETAYKNSILWRHTFVHAGNATATYGEVVSAYEAGKEIIHCLAEAMKK